MVFLWRCASRMWDTTQWPFLFSVLFSQILGYSKILHSQVDSTAMQLLSVRFETDPRPFFFFFPPMSLISYCQECRCVSSLYSKVSHRQTEKENTEVISSIRCVYTSMLDLWSYKYSLISRVVHICIQLSQFALIFNIYSSLQSLGNLINYTHPPSIIS